MIAHRLFEDVADKLAIKVARPPDEIFTWNKKMALLSESRAIEALGVIAKACARLRPVVLWVPGLFEIRRFRPV